MKIDMTKSLIATVGLAEAHLDDIESGLEDGTYDKEDNRTVASDRASVSLISAALEGLQGRSFDVSQPFEPRVFAAIQVTASLARSQVEEISSGLEDGTYRREDNQNLPTSVAGLKAIEEAIEAGVLRPAADAEPSLRPARAKMKI